MSGASTYPTHQRSRRQAGQTEGEDHEQEILHRVVRCLRRMVHRQLCRARRAVARRLRQAAESVPHGKRRAAILSLDGARSHHHVGRVRLDLFPRRRSRAVAAARDPIRDRGRAAHDRADLSDLLRGAADAGGDRDEADRVRRHPAGDTRRDHGVALSTARSAMSLQSLLGIELPVIQAPMAGVQGSALAIAVSNAGGLGSLPCAMLDVDAIRNELAAISAQTAAPFNVNFFCHTPPTPSAEREAAWRAALAPYYRELELDIDAIPAGPGRSPFSAEAADVLAQFKPPVVSFHFGLPSDDLLARVRSRGAKILSSATTVDEARWLERRGVDAIIAQGLEAGGHRGIFLSDDLTTQVGTLALVPQIVKAVSVPVIAAGGIADAKGVAAAMALGAAGAQVGTRSEERRVGKECRSRWSPYH